MTTAMTPLPGSTVASPRTLRAVAGRLTHVVWLAAVIVGVPTGLWRTVGWPLPEHVSSADIARAWSMGDLASATVIKALACIVWVAWMLVAISVVVHVVARARNVVVHRPRLIPAFVFAATGRWLSGVTLAASTTVMSMTPTAFAATRPLAAVTATLDAASAHAPLTTHTTITTSTPPSTAAITATTPTWTVADGETLWEIAEATLGDGSRWNDIFDANRSVIASTDHLPAGTRLIIPTNTTPTTPVPTTPVPTTPPPPTPSSAASVTVTVAPVATQVEPTPDDVDDALADDAVFGTVTVERGDHFWKLSKVVLGQAYGRTPTRHELDRYWRAMVELNREHVPSGDVNLIHPGENYDVALPELPDDATNRTITVAHLVTRLDTPALFPPAERTTVAAPTIDTPSSTPPATPDTAPDTAPPSAPSTTATTVVPASATPVAVADSTMAPLGLDDDTSSDSGNLARLAIAGLGLSAVGAGAVLVALRRRRAVAARQRGIGEQLAVAPEDLLSVLQRLRGIAASDVTATVDATQRLLRHQLATDHLTVPAILVVRAGRNGVELLLDKPRTHDLPAACVAVDDGNCWVLSPDVTADELDSARTTSTGLLPALVSIGSNDVGTVLVDLERLGALEIRCDDPATTGVGVLAAMAAEWEGAPWLDREEARILGIGLDPNLFANFERIQVINDDDIAATVGALADAARNDAIRFPAGKHAQRVATDALLFGPTIVLVGPGHPEVAAALGEAALLSGSGLCVVAACPLPHGASQLVITGTAAVLEPFGLDLDHIVCLSANDAQAVASLVDASDDITPALGWPPAWNIDPLDDAFHANGVHPNDGAFDETGFDDGSDEMWERDWDRSFSDSTTVEAVSNGDRIEEWDDVDPDDDWGSVEAVNESTHNSRDVPADVEILENPHDRTLRLGEASALTSTVTPLGGSDADAAESGDDEAHIAHLKTPPFENPRVEKLADDRDDDDPSDDDPSGGGPPNTTDVASLDGDDWVTDATGPDSAEDSVAMATRLRAELAAPIGEVTLRILAEPMPVLAGTVQDLNTRRAPRCVELLTFLALRGAQTPARVLEALWPDKTDQRTAVASTSRIRGAIAPATITLTDDRYGLDGIDCDWHRFRRLVETANTLDSIGASIVLEAALELVACRPFEGRRLFDGRSSPWGWLDVGYLEADVLVRIVDAAEALAAIALHHGDAAKALWACEKARMIEPHREATHLLRMRAYALLGDRDSLHREVRQAHESASLDDPLADRSANVAALLRVLDAQLNAPALDDSELLVSPRLLDARR